MNFLISISGEDGLFIPCSYRQENGTVIVEAKRHSKRCKECRQVLELTKFGTDNSRLDKLNGTCRGCVRALCNLRRDTRRANKVERKPCQPVRRIYEMKLKPKESVMRAIRAGANTQAEIRRSTRLTEDEVCDAIADLYAENKLNHESLKRRIYRAA